MIAAPEGRGLRFVRQASSYEGSLEDLASSFDVRAKAAWDAAFADPAARTRHEAEARTWTLAAAYLRATAIT